MDKKQRQDISTRRHKLWKKEKIISIPKVNHVLQLYKTQHINTQCTINSTWILHFSQDSDKNGPQNILVFFQNIQEDNNCLVSFHKINVAQDGRGNGNQVLLRLAVWKRATLWINAVL